MYTGVKRDLRSPHHASEVASPLLSPYDIVMSSPSRQWEESIARPNGKGFHHGLDTFYYRDHGITSYLYRLCAYNDFQVTLVSDLILQFPLSDQVISVSALLLQ